jgi:hypothetical protein
MSQPRKQTPLERRVTCANCDWSGTESQLRDISDFWGRVDVGGEMPAGECPECQALAYLAEEDNPHIRPLQQPQHTQQPRQAHANTLHALHTLYGVLADLVEWDAQMGGHKAPCWDRAHEAMESARNVVAEETPAEEAQ